LFLFIGESLGMQELIFIGIIALIVFGPRKLPQMARTIGKAMAEFRKATNEFKETWEKEVDFDEFKEDKTKPILPIENYPIIENSIAKNGEPEQSKIAVPEIREMNQADFEQKFPKSETENNSDNKAAKVSTGKQDWL
jgi:sec-independent protein translocase protein TatA